MSGRIPWRAIGVVLVAVVIVASSAIAYRLAAIPETLSETSVVSTSAPVELVTLHVAGAVRSPGLVTVPAQARAADAIAAAGGASRTADPSLVNLAASVSDGMQLIVPLTSDIAGPRSFSRAVDDGRIDINTASTTELTDLPGVGDVLAERIVAFLETNGPFGTVEDLLSVSGIGEGKLAAIRDIAVVP